MAKKLIIILSVLSLATAGAACEGEKKRDVGELGARACVHENPPVRK